VLASYAWRELTRNPRRTLASLAGVVLGVGLFSGVLFFIDGSAASMTRRAVAPLVLDMQRVSTNPLGEGLRLDQRLVPAGPLRTGERAKMTLTVRNLGAAPANEVVVNDKLPPALEYVPGTARRASRPMRDVAGQSPFAYGLAQIGHNIGTVPAGATVRLSYLVRARRRVPAAAGLALRGTISTREDLVPDPANRPPLMGLGELRDRMAGIPGVRSADELAFADLAPGSLHADGVTVDKPIRVFGFTRAYADHYRSIRLAEGGFEPGTALLTPEAARDLGVGVGARVKLTLPGGARPLELPVGGIADLSRARPLFNSRKGIKFEDFVYVADSIVISPELFRRTVVPAFRAATAARGGSALKVKTAPILEVDALVERSRLDADPASALRQTEAIAKAVKDVAPQQDFLLDNISNTLRVAREDAAVAKRMFLFLGLPGLLLAAFLAAYAGSVLAAAQRREQAKLRLRGAHRGHLVRILAYRTAAVAGVGAVLGTLGGFASAAVILGPSALSEAAGGELLASALVAVGAGVLVTGLALYIPGHRALGREVSRERREMAMRQVSAWRRLHLDYAAVAVAALAVAIALRAGAFDTPPGSVSQGVATSLRSHLLLLPVTAWFAGTLLSVRAVEGVATRLPVPAPPRFGPIVAGVLARSLSRRGALLAGIVGVGLVTAFGIGLAVFAATYDAAKAADARFTVGSNLRVTPSPLSRRAHPVGYGSDLRVRGIASTTPVVAGLENAFVRSAFNSDAKDLAAIDPVSFSRTAALSDAFFPGSTAAEAMAALRRDPRAILVDAESAGDLKLEVGDTAEVLLARGTKNQQNRVMRVAGLFDRFPGFPEHLHIVANLGYYQAQTGLRDVDFFLARTTDQSDRGLADAVSALRTGPAGRDRLNIDSTKTTFNKDQSSLAAPNIHGLVDLDSFYTLVMSAAVIAIFVFGLMLQRRREYVMLRAQGLASRKLQALILGEAGFVALGGLIAGIIVGGIMGVLLVHILKPLFILEPVPTLPLRDAAILAGLVVAATLASTLAALVILARLRPSEVLREQ